MQLLVLHASRLCIGLLQVAGFYVAMVCTCIAYVQITA